MQIRKYAKAKLKFKNKKILLKMLNAKPYSLRVNLSQEVTKFSLMKYFEEITLTYMIAEEKGKKDSNPHVHIYFHYSKSPETIRSALRQSGLKGNESYSLKEADKEYPIPLIAYLLKEDPNVIISNIPEDVIEQARKYDLKVKEDKKTKKEAKTNIIEKLEEYCKKEIEMFQIDPLQFRPICPKIIKYHVDNKIQIRMFQIESLLTTILCRNSKNFVIQLSEKITDRLLNNKN